MAIAPDESDNRTRARVKPAGAPTPAPAAPKATTPSTFTYGAGNPSFITSLQQVVSDANVAKGLNPDGSKKTNVQIFQEGIAARDAERAALATADPIFNKASEPSAPPGFKYTWIGGTNTGKWTLYPVSTGGEWWSRWSRWFWRNWWRH
jgi:hypothetical protein